MLESLNQDQRKKNIKEVKTFSVPLDLETTKEEIIIPTESITQPSKEEIINKAINLHQQGNISEATRYYQLLINQGFKDHRIFSNYGAILKSLDKLQEAELYTQKAIELKPDLAELHINMATIMKGLGKLKDAELSIRKAIKIKPDFVEAKINLNDLSMKQVPRWHIRMINDYERNNAYLKAIKCAMKDNKYVLEIGTGSGILSMMAIDAGATKVVTCENNKSIFDVAKKIISKNGYQEQIKIINKNSKELNIGTDLSQRADLIISEIFSSEFVGEGIQSSIVDAEKRLLKEGGKMIPEAGEIKLALLQRNSKVENVCFTGIVHEYDLSDFNQITGSKFTEKVDHSNISFLSNDNIAFSFDFYSKNIIKKKEKIIKIVVSESGICLGLITWMKINLYENIYYENNPSSSNESHWATPIYTFDKPLKVSKGEIIKIKATLLEDKVWFELIQ